MSESYDVYGLPQAPPIGETVTSTPAENGAQPTTRRRARRTNMATVTARPVGWWWKPRIALGKVHVLAGDPGTGKSYLTTTLAAVNSRCGGMNPDGSAAATGPRKSLILQVEDDLDDTTKPRLDKLGADSSLIETFGLDDVFVLDPAGLQELELHLGEVRPSLVVVDPVTFFIGRKVDMHRANEVREPLAELGRLAKEYQCAVVLVAHLNKGEAKALYRVLGSIDFTAAVRSVLLAGRVEGEPERGRALFHVKSNVGKEAPPIGYDIVEDEDGDDVGKFVWLPETTLTQAEVEGRRHGRPPDRFEEAKAWLREELRAGPRDAGEMWRASADAGFSEGTMKRAAKVTVYKEQVEGQAGSWTWSLPPLPRFPDPPSVEGGSA